MEAYCVNLERLSMQAHLTAAFIGSGVSNSVAIGGDAIDISTTNTANNSNLANLIPSSFGEEEYIVQAFLESNDKVHLLVRTLLGIEVWREHVLFAKGDNTTNEYGGVDDVHEEYNYLNEVDGGGDDEQTLRHQQQLSSKERLATHLASNGNVLRTAFILHAETTIVQMLNLIFYRGIPSSLLDGNGEKGGGDEVLLALVDYCARQLVRLLVVLLCCSVKYQILHLCISIHHHCSRHLSHSNSNSTLQIFLGTPAESNPSIYKQKHPLPTCTLSTHLQSRTRLNEIRDSVHDSTYQTAIASVALSRYLCENMEEMGISLVSRMLEVHDFPLLMVPLIEEPPWTRRRLVERKNGEEESSKMVWEKLDENSEWKEVSPSDLLRVTKLEGQPWLALYHLTTSKVCRESYGLDEYRKSQLMRLRRYIHETLLDQLPVLGEVARYLDELSILGVPAPGQGVHRPSSNASSSGLLLQRVDSLRESIVGKQHWKDESFWSDVVEKQWNEIFSRVTDSKDKELRRIASEVYEESELDDDVGVGGETFEPGTSQSNLDKASSTLDTTSWKIALAKPLKCVTLRLEGGTQNTVEFELTSVNNGQGTVTDTPLGKYRRIKLAISQTAGDGEALFPNANAIASIVFQQDALTTSEVYLTMDSLSLPTDELNSTPNNYEELGISLPDHFPSKKWCQLGDLQEKSVVLQIGFKRLECGVVPAGCTLLRGYALSQAFLCQPVV
jgi:hypothetical protein